MIPLKAFMSTVGDGPLLTPTPSALRRKVQRFRLGLGLKAELRWFLPHVRSQPFTSLILLPKPAADRQMGPLTAHAVFPQFSEASAAKDTE